ncbi:outer membrane beta-barrel protein [Rhodomicrobium sp. Az07]|uniref:outer membrane protein n=1 Tax=Rhodomicrobium sp. Az07 TaxID=2839034 RepID=UPI001BEB28EF|nr:outer membrane beta-barrel protein [Rhodomicrobium sp. Az07]MBT3071255.1 outer membrane beta-barrel protein [Rhodomicrobium sp. Az07]
MALKHTILAGAAAIGAAAIAAIPVYADGIPASYKDTAPPPPLWTGLYVGAHLGGGWTDIDFGRNRYYDYTFSQTSPYWYDYTGGLSGSGVFGGFTLGYNFQFGQCCNYIYGIELDIGGWRDDASKTIYIDDDRRGLDPDASTRIRFTNRGGFYGDITGRLGYAAGNTLIYAKGGFAWLNNSFRVGVNRENGGTGYNYDWSSTTDNGNTLAGWTVGGGLEYKWNYTWSVKAEYLYFNFGEPNVGGGCCYDYQDGISADAQRERRYGADFKDLGDLTASSFKLGVNYAIFTPPAHLK